MDVLIHSAPARSARSEFFGKLGQKQREKLACKRPKQAIYIRFFKKLDLTTEQKSFGFSAHSVLILSSLFLL